MRTKNFFCWILFYCSSASIASKDLCGGDKKKDGVEVLKLTGWVMTVMQACVECQMTRRMESRRFVRARWCEGRQQLMQGLGLFCLLP